MLATYHNHSTWSDGKAAPRALLDAARHMNIDELGISDHWVLHPNGERKKWAMRTETLPEYVADLTALRDEVAATERAPVLRIGLEVDWFPSPPAPPDYRLRLRAALDKHPFDYLIASVHEVDGFTIDGSPEAWRKLTQDEINQMHRRYWMSLVSLAESGLFDIVAHIDLPKKFGFYATVDLSREIAAALDAIAEANRARPLVVEVNTAGWHKPCADAYPSVEILRECRRRAIPTTISADAHQPEHLLRDFDRAAARLAEAGYTHLTRFARREARSEPL